MGCTKRWPDGLSPQNRLTPFAQIPMRAHRWGSGLDSGSIGVDVQSSDLSLQPLLPLQLLTIRRKG